MGKIVASYLIKAHLHAPDVADEEGVNQASALLTNDDVKQAVIDGLQKELGGEVTVSLIERTDSD